MRHSDIAATAISAALAAAMRIEPERNFLHEEDDSLIQLYGYCRERGFPQPETLARKHAELVGAQIRWMRLADADQEQQAFYQVFRAVAHSLEPFHEPDPEGVEPDLADAGMPTNWIYNHLQGQGGKLDPADAGMSASEIYNRQQEAERGQADPPDKTADPEEGKADTADTTEEEKMPETEKTETPPADEKEAERKEFQNTTEEEIAKAQGTPKKSKK